MAYTDQQPQAQPGMQVDQKNSLGLPFENGERDWSYGVFDCLAEPVTCLVSWFLPCVTYGRNQARYRSLVERNEANNDPMDGIISEDSIKYGALQCCGCGWIFGMQGRGEARARYRIRGDGASDCFLSCCCAPCSLTQVSRELELEEKAIGHAGASFNMFLAQKK